MNNINVESFKEKKTDGFDKLRSEIYTTLKELENMEVELAKVKKSKDLWAAYAAALTGLSLCFLYFHYA